MIILTNCCGFFSNFFKVLNWELVNHKNTTIVPYFITRSVKELTCIPYSNIDRHIYPERENIWELMFCPIREYKKIQLNDQKNIFTWDYPKYNNWGQTFPYPLNQFKWGYIFCNYSIYVHPLLPKIREVYHNCYKKFKWTQYLNTHIENNLKIIPNPKKTVAVFIRCQGHYNNLNLDKDYQINKIIEELKVVMENYDNLFLVTIIKPYIDKIKNIFGDKVCFLSDKNISETENHDWGGVHRDAKKSLFIPDKKIDYKKECVQCFTDVYLASTCDYILGGSSNMFLGALIINPTVKFKILDIFKEINGA